METIESIAAWQDATFGPVQSRARSIARANEELAELIRAWTSNEPPEKIIALGFSQGCPAVLRWQAEGNAPANEIVIWSGDVPRDLAFAKFKANTEKARKWMVYSQTDEFITPAIYKESENLYLSNQIPFEQMMFEGGHRIPDATLKEFRSRIEK